MELTDLFPENNAGHCNSVDGFDHCRAQPAEFDSKDVHVVVLGTHHFRQHSSGEIPVAGDVIVHSLLKFKPDHIVVEWLQPGIDPSTTFNYRPLGDKESYARLWGYQLKDIETVLALTESVLTQLKLDSVSGRHHVCCPD